MPGKMARSDPRPSVQVTRGAGSGQHLASVLQEGRGNANIDAGLGVIWRISVYKGNLPARFGWKLPAVPFFGSRARIGPTAVRAFSHPARTGWLSLRRGVRPPVHCVKPISPMSAVGQKQTFQPVSDGECLQDQVRDRIGM